MLSHSLKQPLTGSPSLGRPGATKPSGLKLPSPKIGFFDGVKSGSKTPSRNVGPRSALPSGLPRLGSGTYSPSGPPNSAKLGSTATKVKSTAAGTLRTDPRRSSVSAKSTQLVQDHSVGLPKPLSGITVDNDFGTSSESPKGVSVESLIGRYAEATEKAGAGEQIADSISDKDLPRSGLESSCRPSDRVKPDNSSGKAKMSSGTPKIDSQSINVSTELTEVVQEYLMSFPKPPSVIKVDNSSGVANTAGSGSPKTDSQSINVFIEPTEVVLERSLGLPMPSSEIKVDISSGEVRTTTVGTHKTNSQSISASTEPIEVVRERLKGMPKPSCELTVDNSSGKVKTTAVGTPETYLQSISASMEPIEIVGEHSAGLCKPSSEHTVDNSSGKAKTTAARTLEIYSQCTTATTESTELVQENSVDLPKPSSEVTADNSSGEVETTGTGILKTDSQSTRACTEPTEAVQEHSASLPVPSSEFKVDTDSDTHTEVTKCISSQPLIESTAEGAEKAGIGEQITDFVSDKYLSANLPKHSVLQIPDNISDGLSEFQNVSANIDSAVPTHSEVTEGVDSGKYVEILVAKDNSHGLPVVSSAKKLDGDSYCVPELPASTPSMSCSKYDSEGAEVRCGAADFNSIASDNSLGLASPANYDNSVCSSELPTSFPSKSGSEHNFNIAQVTDGGKEASYCGMVVRYDSNVPGKEVSTAGKMQLQIGSSANTVDRADFIYISCASPSAEVGHRNRSKGSTMGNLNSFPEGNVAFRAADGVPDSGRKSVESKQNICTKKQEETPDHKVHQPESILEQPKAISSCAKQSCNPNEHAKHESPVQCSFPPSVLAASPESRTPLTVKNTASAVVEACKPFAGTTMEAVVQADIISFLEKIQKENN